MSRKLVIYASSTGLSAVIAVLLCAALAGCVHVASDAGASSQTAAAPAQTAAEQSGNSPPAGVQAGVRMTLVATPSPDQSRSFRFVAEITGGEDKELYCQAMTWAFGDGPGLTVTPSCMPWSADVKVPRHFERSHTYQQAGTYDVRFAYGPVSARVSVEAR